MSGLSCWDESRPGEGSPPFSRALGGFALGDHSAHHGALAGGGEPATHTGCQRDPGTKRGCYSDGANEGARRRIMGLGILLGARNPRGCRVSRACGRVGAQGKGSEITWGGNFSGTQRKESTPFPSPETPAPEGEPKSTVHEPPGPQAQSERERCSRLPPPSAQMNPPRAARRAVTPADSAVAHAPREPVSSAPSWNRTFTFSCANFIGVETPPECPGRGVS